MITLTEDDVVELSTAILHNIIVAAGLPVEAASFDRARKALFQAIGGHEEATIDLASFQVIAEAAVNRLRLN